MTTKYPNTALGAEMALQAMARRHMALRTVAGPEDGSWRIDVMWVPEDEHATCMVYLAPHPLGAGPHGADFETLD